MEERLTEEPFWPALLSAALLGGRQAAPPPLPANHPLAGHIADADPNSLRLLRLAGAWDWYQRSGGRPPTATAPLAPAPPFVDPRPVCPPAVAHCLRQLLAGRHPGVWEEALTGIAAAGLRLPPTLLPDLLQWGQRSHRLQARLCALLGPRGQWLAEQEPNWWYARSAIQWPELIERWRQTSAVGRAPIFNSLRVRDPQLARTLLQNMWPNSDDATRLRLIRLLRPGLTLADEPFLETARGDRHKLVRSTAAELLSRLPDSAYARRFRTYAADLLRWRPAGAAPAALLVRLPGRVTDSMAHDGIPVLAKSDRQKKTLRQRQLSFIIAAAPLTTWTDKWDQSPAAIIAAAAHSRYPRTLMQAFAAAATRQEDPDWIVAILRQESFHERVGRLVSLLPLATFESLALSVAAADSTLQKDAPLLTLLDHWRGPLTPALVPVWRTALLDHSRRSDSKRPPHRQQSILRRFVNHCPLTELDTLSNLLTDIINMQPEWRSGLRSLQRTVAFRQQLSQALATPPSLETS